MLNEESEKLFTALEKMLTEEVIDHYVSKTSATLLPMLPFDDKQQQKSSS
jgi:hypothetical protein